MEVNTTFEKLKGILSKFESHLSLMHDKEDNYYLNTPVNAVNQKAEFFGAVQIKKSYVAYHLYPVYSHPELLNDISENLKKCMQGKSCFNFKEVDKEIFKELSNLTKASFDKYKSLKKC